MRALSTTVGRRLLQDATFDIEFHGYLSNHVKHAIIALDRIDAPPTRIQEYWNDYTKLTPYSLPLHPVSKSWDQVAPATPTQWQQWRGQKIHWQEQVSFLQQELQDRFQGDTNKLVQEYATADLLNGQAGALTHGLIHLGWSIDAQSPWMICEGLAYLNFCHLLGPVTSIDNANIFESDSMMDSLTRVATRFEADNLQSEWVDQAKAAFDESFHPELVAAGFQWQLSKVLAQSHTVVTDLPSWLQAFSIDDEAWWKSLYQSLTQLYLATRSAEGQHGNFVVLHSLTAAWGLEQTLRVLKDPATQQAAVVAYYQMLVSLLATAGFPASFFLLQQQQDLAVDAQRSNVDWTPIVKAGMAEEEEHNIKLVYVARELWNRFDQWPGFVQAAESFTLTPNIGPKQAAFSAE